MYIEDNCTFTHEGKSFTAGGAFVTPERIAVYPDSESMNIPGRVLDWHGNKLGTCKVLSTWQTPRSFIGNRMFSYECLLSGIRFVGRGHGKGCILFANVSSIQPLFGTRENAIQAMRISLAMEIMAYEA